MKINNIKSAYRYFFLILTFILPVEAFSYDAIFNVSGRVQAGTCSMSSSRVQNVNLGDHLINSSFGLKNGSTTKPVEWSLVFDCGENTGMSIRLSGDAPYRGTILRLSGRDAATGLGIETRYRTSLKPSISHIMMFDSNISTRSNRENGGPFTVFFESYYKQTADVVTPGPANGDLNLDIYYE